MGTLSYGLNITKKTGARQVTPAKRKALFEEDDSDTEKAENDTEHGVEVIGVLGDTVPQEQAPREPLLVGNQKGSKQKGKSAISLYGDISSIRTSSKHSKEATAIDSAIYDYDAAYDALHATSARKSAAQAEDLAARKPRYMSNLLAAAETRKRDQLRAKEKMLMKEREAEGDEFADKDKFVTGAYKAQQEDVKRLEEEEKLREEEEQRRRKGKGMTGFYRNVLDRDEKKHEEAVAAAAAAAVATGTNSDRDSSAGQKSEKGTTEADIARNLKAQGRDITMNDEGQVVDKRQLLSAGLNIAPKPHANKANSAAQSRAARSSPLSGPQGKAGTQQAMRERQTRMLEEQLMQATKQAADEEEEKKLALEKTAKSKKTEGEISSAKERYLQRKKEAQQAAKG